VKKGRGEALRVGAFLLFGLVALGAVVFLIGQERGLFRPKVTLYAHFDNTSGLVAGAPVRLAGLDVGTVESVSFPAALERTQATIEMRVDERYLSRIRHDSRAFIDSKGLLGDKIINITLGSTDAPGHVDGDTLQTRSSPSVEAIATSLEDAFAAVTRVSGSADEAIRELASEEVRQDVARIARSTANLLEAIEKKDGALHRLIYDDAYAEEVLVALRHTGNAAKRLDRVVTQVQQGPGSLHELIYGNSGTETLEHLRAASGSLADALAQMRDGDGLLHALLYDPQKAQSLDELNQLVSRLNQIASDVQSGRGTVGGLLVDPSVYEDMKQILGNVERNVVLKALMRFAIKEGDIERPARVPKPSPRQ
jgi:phospholipid/cholesterol/gamma-HCH transport system substrate-binding protein